MNTDQSRSTDSGERRGNEPGEEVESEGDEERAQEEAAEEGTVAVVERPPDQPPDHPHSRRRLMLRMEWRRRTFREDEDEHLRNNRNGGRRGRRPEILDLPLNHPNIPNRYRNGRHFRPVWTDAEVMEILNHVDDEIDDRWSRYFHDREDEFFTLRHRIRRFHGATEDWRYFRQRLREQRLLQFDSFQAWMSQEQRDYQCNMGCTFWNKNHEPGGIYVHKMPKLQDTTSTMTNPNGQKSPKISSTAAVQPKPEQERVCPRYHPELLLLKRIRACIGWAVHGLIFEFIDGKTRSGYSKDVSNLYDEDSFDHRHATDWVDVTPGDFVIAVHGNNLARNCFMCHSVHFEMASGNRISFVSPHLPWKGEPYHYDVPETSLLQFVSFQDGKCKGLTVAETLLHLPVQSPQRVLLLDKEHQKTFEFLLLTSIRIDNERFQNGQVPLGRDLWRTILYEFLACYDLQDCKSSEVGKLLVKNRKRQGKQLEPSLCTLS